MGTGGTKMALKKFDTLTFNRQMTCTIVQHSLNFSFSIEFLIQTTEKDP